jgi:antitoxin VapB
MASLYIKDQETAALAQQVAADLGTTKTAAVRKGLLSLRAEKKTSPAQGSTAQWLRDHRARRPLPDREKMRADKAFYDSLSDEEDDLGLLSR